MTSSATRGVVAELQRIVERRNALIHELFVRRDYTECLRVIEAQLRASDGTCEYALYVKGLLRRYDGQLTESLALFSTAVLVAPTSVCSRTQLGRALQLLARYDEAVATYRAAAALRAAAGLDADWQLDYYIGTCYVQQQHQQQQQQRRTTTTTTTRADDDDGDDAVAVSGEHAMAAFARSLRVQPQSCTYRQLARMHVARGALSDAVTAYTQALALSPDDADVLAALAQLYVRGGGDARATAACLRQCRARLAAAPQSASVALVATTCSLLQCRDGDDDDERNDGKSSSRSDNTTTMTPTATAAHVLHWYGGALAQAPTSSQLWCNVGAAYMAKRSAHAAVSCLRRALACDALDWAAHYNLGLVYLRLHRAVAALRHLTAAARLLTHTRRACKHNEDSKHHEDSNGSRDGDAHRRFGALAHMYRGVCLSLLGDVDAACAAYATALHIYGSTVTDDEGRVSDDDDDGDDEVAALLHLNYAITLWNCGRVAQAVQQLAHFQDCWRTDASGEHNNNNDDDNNNNSTAAAAVMRNERRLALRERRMSRRYDTDSLTSLAAYLADCIAAVRDYDDDDARTTKKVVLW